jgi:hypothetical protein
MKSREAKLDHATLTRLLDYDPSTGVFRWKERTSNRVKVGDVAGVVDTREKKGHRYLCINGIRYAAHRVAWFYVKKVWPKLEIDHRNLCGDDNWIDNLREATHQQNMRNVAMRKRNRTGFKGVVPHSQAKNKFTAQISVDGVTRYLGLFNTPEEAHQRYAEASLVHHHEYGRSS